MKGSLVQISGNGLIGINGKTYYVTRVIWKLMTGLEPGFIVDHHNGIPWDLRWENLREANSYQNIQNTARGSPYPGIKVNKKSFTVRISVNGEIIKVGRFKTRAEAEAARVKAEDEHWGEFSPSNRPGGHPGRRAT